MRLLRLLLLLMTLGIQFAYGVDGSAPFDTQMPSEPGTFDAPSTSSHTCELPVNPLVVKWRTPTAGVTGSTGLVVVLQGVATDFDCVRNFDVQDAAWPDAKNVVVCNVFYRNYAFISPYDLGKLQVVDALRGVAKVLEEYPQLDRRRLYLYGLSGGGQLSLQLLQCSRHLWAEVHVHCAPTLVTSDDDVANNGYENDRFGEGIHPLLGFPMEQGTLPDREWRRYQAERALRSPQRNVAMDLPVAGEGAGDYPFVWSMHGTADEGVDVQHFYDMRDAVVQAMGVTPVPAAVVGGQQWTLGRWTFVAINGANHHYAGAHTSMNTFNKATNYHVPTAFTRSRPAAPVLAVDYGFPWHYGWRFRVAGAMGSVVLVTEEMPSAAGEWMLYE